MKQLPFLTTAESAEYLGISVYHMTRLIREGKVTAVNVSRRIDGRASWRVSVKSLEKFVAERERVANTSDPKVREWRRGA